jgi:hypothetical protein
MRCSSYKQDVGEWEASWRHTTRAAMLASDVSKLQVDTAGEPLRRDYNSLRVQSFILS